MEELISNLSMLAITWILPVKSANYKPSIGKILETLLVF